MKRFCMWNTDLTVGAKEMFTDATGVVKCAPS